MGLENCIFRHLSHSSDTFERVYLVIFNNFFCLLQLLSFESFRFCLVFAAVFALPIYPLSTFLHPSIAMHMHLHCLCVYNSLSIDCCCCCWCCCNLLLLILSTFPFPILSICLLCCMFLVMHFFCCCCCNKYNIWPDAFGSTAPKQRNVQWEGKDVGRDDDERVTKKK